MQFVFTWETAIKIMVPGARMQIYPQARPVKHCTPGQEGTTEGLRIRSSRETDKEAFTLFLSPTELRMERRLYSLEPVTPSGNDRNECPLNLRKNFLVTLRTVSVNQGFVCHPRKPNIGGKASCLSGLPERNCLFHRRMAQPTWKHASSVTFEMNRN